MTASELLSALRLQRIPNIGDITAKKLISYCGSPEAVFSDSKRSLSKIEGIGTFTLHELHKKTYLAEAEAEYNFIRSNKFDVALFTDVEYPDYLKHCSDGPFLLFMKGNIRLENKRVLSVVGTRTPSPNGKAFCEKFIEELAPFNPVVVSGFAYGIDIAIQKAAMQANLQTIGCLAHGLNQIYPKPHKKYQASVEVNGGFVTEFWSSSIPDRMHFLRRNRIIAGMSEATVVVESADKGGSLVTAALANSYNREVFAVPGRVSDKFSQGCNQLIKGHRAQLITSAADLIYLMNWDKDTMVKKPRQQSLFTEMNDKEKHIYEYLTKHGKQLLDTIALECRLPVYKVSSSLFEMEMQGWVRCLPGKMFEAV
ncbi:DNA-processing protein DprA [Poritiphilus flavus]|uniref:DNA-protecting protein DprA n=1 Tax=Poritiphilus flavus TaxID=2697053 RepID=A0A6L9E818_9FLAO|nr:DNA-processing protein DprA [Poritiphilus flavus]NAS10925.1 DNA-protecting protein DprA [Poritiphilus flavus]